MSSGRRDSGPSPDTTSNRRLGAPAKNGVELAHNGPASGFNGSYEQRRSHVYNDYGGGNGVLPKQSVQMNGDYSNYYPSTYPMNDHYGGWATGGGSSGFYHHHPQAISQPMTNAYMDNMTLFGGGNGQPTDHSGYNYYNYFPTNSATEYNTWGGTSFVTSQPRSGGSSKHAEFYPNPVTDYSSSGSYGRGTGGTHQLEQTMAQMTVYDEPLTTGNNTSSGGGGGYHRASTNASIGESKKKSWATIAGQPAKPTLGGGILGMGRGKGRGIPIGGVPGSAKSENYIGNTSGGSFGSMMESGGFWAASTPQPQQSSATTQRSLAAISPPAAIGQDKTSARSAEAIRNMDNGTTWNSNSVNRGGNKNDYLPYSSNMVDSLAYSKRCDTDALNGAGADGDDRPYEERATEPKKLGGIVQRADNQSPPGKITAKDYNPKEFTMPMKGARFFVIKSYSEDDVHRSIKYGIWCSTDHGNKRLDMAYREREGKGPIYLLFSVNASGHFCGVAQMTSPLDYEKSSGVWAQDKWKGQFSVKWIYVKDVPNQQLRHIRLENNENKPVTNSRDTQEVPAEKGRQVLKIIHQYVCTTSLFDDFAHYERRQEEENSRKGKRGTGDDY